MNDQDNYDSQSWGQDEEERQQQWEQHKNSHAELKKVLKDMNDERTN